MRTPTWPVRGQQPTVLGYYAVSSHMVRHADLPSDQAKGLPRIDVPVVLLGRLAVDRSVQGQGLGSLLLMDALRRAEHLAEQLGIRESRSMPSTMPLASFTGSSVSYRFSTTHIISSCRCPSFANSSFLEPVRSLNKRNGTGITSRI